MEPLITLYEYIQAELIKQGKNEMLDANGNLIFFREPEQFMTKIFSYDADVSSIVDKLFTNTSLKMPEHDLNFKKGFLYRFINRRINRQTIEAFRLQLLSTFLTNQDYINRIYGDLELYLIQTKINEQTNQQLNKEKNSQTNTQTSKQKNLQTDSSTNEQTNTQNNDALTTTDNREAEAILPQNNVQLDVNSTVMESANNNRISRNKQANNQTSVGETTGNSRGESIADSSSDSESTAAGESEGETSGETFGEYKDYQLDELMKTKNLHDQIYLIFDRKCFMQTW